MICEKMLYIDPSTISNKETKSETSQPGYILSIFHAKEPPPNASHSIMIDIVYMQECILIHNTYLPLDLLPYRKKI
jgi:hypothetical protein